MPEDYIECDPFTVVCTNSSLVEEEKYYLQAYLGNYTYKIVDKRMIGHLDDNPF